jgi:hypothetical protein
MKKVLAFAALSMLLANSAFAAELATNTPTQPAVAVYGGVVGAAATAPTPLIKFSTGVRGIVEFADNTAYLIGTKHDTGSKMFGTNNAVTNIYWKQPATTGALTADMFGITSAASSNFVGNGWTSY